MQIEFPSILLPQGISSGSIVDIEVSRNISAETASANAFQQLQEEIYQQFGIHSPAKPQLRIRNATQTSVVLEWDPIELATANLRSLTLYRNNAKSGAIPNPTNFTTTKISGLAVDTEYTFHLVLKTSAGTYTSDKVAVRTQKMTDLSGITVCTGVMPPEAKEHLEVTLQRIGARPLQDFVRIDTTHFVCTEGRGQAWERATEMNIPVVRPEWVEACEREGRIVGVRAYYLNADPRLRPALRERGQPRPMSQPASQPPPQQQPQQTQPPQQQQQQQPPLAPAQPARESTNPPSPEVPRKDTPGSPVSERKELPVAPSPDEAPKPAEPVPGPSAAPAEASEARSDGDANGTSEDASKNEDGKGKAEEGFEAVAL